MPFLSSFDAQFVDGAVGERRSERVVHATVLVEEGDAVERGAHHGDLEMVSGAGSIRTSSAAASGNAWTRSARMVSASTGPS